ncbi:MAG: hypothetical protein ACUVSQ_03165 [Pseudanabaenaceae cyanobacterium]
MRTLLITVGNRQVGWHSRDGVLRSLGADGDRGNPPHVDELYRELGQERGFHEPGNPNSRWSVAHLGEQLYRECTARQDFGAVVLLMDDPILAQALDLEIERVVLWGTQQPATVDWSYRRNDTRWLAELMAGKIRQEYPQIHVRVWRPSVAINDKNAIQQAVEALLLELVDGSEALTLAIQAKGGAPPITNPLEIAAAAVMRQVPVERLTPKDPKPLFEGPQAQMATEFERMSFGEYFWPVERSRIVSAWERGDFAEAKVWLQAHTDRYGALQELAQHLALAINWQWVDVLRALQGTGGNGWLDRRDLRITKAQRKQWRADIQDQYRRQETPESKFLKLWESRELIRLNLLRQNYTAAFLQLVQLLERLLYWRYETEKWLDKGYVVLPETQRGYRPTLYDLRMGWLRCQNLPENDPIAQRLERINQDRNGVVHNSKSLTLSELGTAIGCPNETSPEVVYGQIEAFLQSFCSAEHPMPSRSLFRELYDWGRQQLQASPNRCDDSP